MNKWIFRLTGMLVIVLLTLLFLDSWLNPDVPKAIEQGVALRDGPQRPSSDASSDNDTIPSPPSLSLTSYQAEDDVQSAQSAVSQDGTPLIAAQNTPPAADNQPEAETETEIPAQPDLGISALENPQPEYSSAAQEPEAQPAPKEVVSQVDTSQAAKSWLQAGSFGERANANKRAAVIKAQGWSVEIAPAKVNGKTYHRVYVGPIKQNQVSAYLGKLQAMGINAREVNR